MTSKTDDPPPYEDAAHQPKYGNYPNQQQDGPTLPPPPSYSPSPSPPGYWGQEGVYPQAGTWAAPGYSPSRRPTTIPTLSAGVHASDQGSVDMRRFPWNLVLLGVFTLALSYMSGTISSYYETKAVFLAMGITAIVCIAVTIFCFQTKVDFTSCGGLLCIASVVLMIIGIVTGVVLSFQYVRTLVPWLHMLYAAIGAVIYTLFLVYNTQLLVGNRELAINPEEYIFGALSLYIDIVHIFLFVLQVGGAATE
ncbi:hypothetical protein F7725_001801 [Dissostichus mawsoni]|uniref:Uncharacterized protein n=1 Tax=Dissostichus mawsoni TaxID=36200 RepID=A0A7J5Y0L7_DISMA|nr:hypothetical protein F7725_001801 [Dissostichus mawsoni]